MPDTIQRLGIIRADTGIIAKYSGGAIKRLNEGTFEGYIIRWHDPQRLDLTGEWFSQRTYLMKNAGYPIVGAPINYQHGMQKDFGSLAIGLVKFTDEDEIGQFVRGELKTRDDYIAMLQEIGRKADVKFSDGQLAQKSDLAIKAVDTLIASVPLQFSGGFDPSTWIVDPQSKHIDQSGVIHAAFTPTPADDLNPQIKFKSAWDEVLKYEPTTTYSFPNSQIQPDGSTPRKDDEVREGAAQPGSDVDFSPTLTHKGIKMDPETLAAIARAVAQEVLAGIAPMLAKEDQAEMPSETEVVSSLTKESMDPTMKPEDIAKALAEKASKMVFDAIKARRDAAASAKAIANEYLKRTLPPIDTLGAASGAGAGGEGSSFGHAKAANVQVYSPYKNWKAEDFAFAASVKHTNGNSRAMRIKLDEKFHREFADKALAEFGYGKLALDERAFKALHAMKANELNYSTQDGYGDEAVPTIWANDIWEKPRLPTVVQAIFDNINMPSNPYEYVVEGTDPTVSFVPETTAENQLTIADSNSPIPDSKIGTDKVTFNAKKHALRVGWSGELDEDAIRALIPKFRQQAEKAISEQGIDTPAILGDTASSGNVNLDGGTPATTAAYKAYDGLIKQALVTASTNKLDAQAAAPSLTLLRATRALLGNAEGKDIGNLAWIVDYPTYMKLLNDDTVVTVDKYGPNATVLTGELGKIDGIPLFVSGQMNLADADGKITSGGNTYNRGRAIVVHRPSWMFAYRREIKQSLEYIPVVDAWQLVITLRTDFKPRSATDGTLQSTDDSVAVLYNLAV